MNSLTSGPAVHATVTDYRQSFRARERGTLADPVDARPLPDQRDLVAAFAGRCEAHPLLDWAQELADLHRARQRNPLTTAGIDCRRHELVARIDNWVRTRIPGRYATRQLRAASSAPPSTAWPPPTCTPATCCTPPNASPTTACTPPGTALRCWPTRGPT